jgi:hypothetical protein
MREMHASLDRRIEALEQRSHLRRGLLATGLVAALGALGLSIFCLSQIQDVYRVGEVATALEARALILRDSEGLERGALRVGEDGTVGLSLKDGQAGTRLRLSVLGDGSPGVSLLDGEGDTRAILGFLPDGTTTLVFADDGSVARAVLALTPDGASRIIFSDSFGQTRAAVGVDGEGRPEVNTMAGEGGGS